MNKLYMIPFKTKMPPPSETIAQYIARTMLEKDISGYDIERRTRKRISQSYANRIKLGEIKTPSLDKLKALAVGLDVPEQELLDIARGATEEKNSQLDKELLYYVHELSAPRQLDLVAIAKALYRREHAKEHGAETKIVLAKSIGETSDAPPAERRKKRA